MQYFLSTSLQPFPDADGDGYSAIGACTGSMDDCDDNNADVNPGAAEVCDNGIDDNCNGATDEDCGGCPECPASPTYNLDQPVLLYFDTDENPGCYIGGGLSGAGILLSDGSVVYAVTDGYDYILLVADANGCACFYVVGFNLTLEEWESALADIRAAIAASPGADNICDGLSGEPSSGLQRNVDVLNKAKEMMQEKLNHE